MNEFHNVFLIGIETPLKYRVLLSNHMAEFVSTSLKLYLTTPSKLTLL